MKVNKLEEILNCLKDKNSDIVLDVSSGYEYGNTYDLTVVSIESKECGTTTIKLGFEERCMPLKRTENRMKNMNISFLKNGTNNSNIEEEDKNE